MSALPKNAAIVVLGSSALDLARRIKSRLPCAQIHAAEAHDLDADVHFAQAGVHLRTLFAASTPIVGLCASGILVRALAPLIFDKVTEPPVVAVAEDGSAVVPILGGHRGANLMAQTIAELAGGIAAITTASDLRFGLALDEPPPGWHIANPDRIKEVAAALLADDNVMLEIEAGDATWLQAGSARFAAHGTEVIRVTDRTAAADEKALVLHPPVLAIGVGCERDTPKEELEMLVRATLASHDLAPDATALVASLDVKADEDAVQRLAESFGVAARFFTAAELAIETSRLETPSEATFRAVGCYGVAEGAALAAVGQDGTLIIPKQKAGRVTCAVARAPRALNPTRIGRARGSLVIIGIGPGDATARTEAANTALCGASDVVGYGLYLDLLGPALAGKTRHDGQLGGEETRARQALDLAATGRAVALVSSGDAGIYGLASLVFELLDIEDRADWRRVAINVVPGVSAVQAAAARLGAPLGHDFCTISLSDLLTPWDRIERRIKAAAAGDFVIALYNPRSTRRTTQLQAAKAILLSTRRGDTPVALARNLGRNGEHVTVMTLDTFEPDDVDMLTIVIIGSTATRRLAGKPLLYTPRGYADKRRS